MVLSLTQDTQQASLKQHRYWMQRLASHGYYEAITYSFCDPQLFGDNLPSALQLSNPISPQLSLMRTSLFPSLLQVLAYNLNSPTQATEAI